LTLHAFATSALFAGAGVAAAMTIRRAILPNLGRIQAALSGKGAF